LVEIRVGTVIEQVFGIKDEEGSLTLKSVYFAEAQLFEEDFEIFGGWLDRSSVSN
jgi:hypothetical protein